MRADDRPQSERDGLSLVPQMVLVPADPEAVCVALQRYAFTPATAEDPPEGIAHGQLGRWTAERQESSLTVTLTLHDGPLGSCVLRFAAQSDGNGSTMLWITGQFRPRRSLLRGILERWQGQRDAVALRDGVVAGVTELVQQQESRSGPTVRRAPRRRVRAHGKLVVAGHGWTGEVLDVSEGGLALVIVCPPVQAQPTATFLLQQKVGEVEFSLPGATDRLQVLVRRAQPARGGVLVGLQVLEPEKILPLLRKAFAARPRAE